MLIFTTMDYFYLEKIPVTPIHIVQIERKMNNSSRSIFFTADVLAFTVNIKPKF